MWVSRINAWSTNDGGGGNVRPSASRDSMVSCVSVMPGTPVGVTRRRSGYLRRLRNEPGRVRELVDDRLEGLELVAPTSVELDNQRALRSPVDLPRVSVESLVQRLLARLPAD